MKTIPMQPTTTPAESGSGMGSTEGARRATGVEPMPGGRAKLNCSPPDPEVPEKKRRRKFTAKYKLRILAEADACDACTDPGELGALLRREGLYSSNLTTWRRQRRKGLLTAMAPQKRGRKKAEINPLASRVAKLEKDNRRLQQKLKRAELIIEAQKKMAEILGISQDLHDSDEGK
jgi:transposase